VGHLTEVPGRTGDVRSSGQGRRFRTRSTMFPSVGRIVPKVSGPDFRVFARNSPDISKGICELGMCEFETSQVSQAFRVSENFLLGLQKGPPMAGFSHRQMSLETDVRTFWAENSQKSPAEFKKTPVFWRLALETEE
jgi:hypothetical protein